MQRKYTNKVGEMKNNSDRRDDRVNKADSGKDWEKWEIKREEKVHKRV